jgi:hypothetical protein
MASSDTSINMAPLGTSFFTKPVGPVNLSFKGNLALAETMPAHDLKVVLSGESFDDVEIPYRWQILKNGEKTGIQVDYFEDPDLKKVLAIVDFQTNTIHVHLIPVNNSKNLSIDPLFQPFGSILMVVLAHHANDIIIHASGVFENGIGRLFTAVSGTGKSTMAGLWEKAGAQIINDDRLWLRKENKQWFMYNTPMPYYAQKPAKAPVNEIFLLRQSPDNQLQKLSGANAAMRFMANSIQHFYDKEMTGRHLDRVMDIAVHTPIYDCGFRPTEEIVGEIRELKVLR